MNSKKEKIELGLRLSVKRAEESITSSSTSSNYKQILEAIHTFLRKWDALEAHDMQTEDADAGNGRNRTLPEDYLRLLFCRVLSNLNPVDCMDLVCGHVLSTLRCVETAACRQIVLEFLPAVTRIACGSDSDNDTRCDGHSKSMKKEIISCLREVFENDTNCLAQILGFFSSFQDEDDSQKKIMGTRDFFLFVLGILPRVPETNLHIALQALIRYVDSADDARVAVDSVRTELALLEKTDISDMLSVATIFDETIRSSTKNEEIFVEEYLIVIEELIDERRRKQNQSHACELHKLGLQLLTFDLVMIVLPKDNPLYRDRIFGMISNGSLMESGLFSAPQLSKLKELVGDNCESIAEVTESSHLSTVVLRQRLLGSLVDISVDILLIPLRCTVELDLEKFFAQVQVLLVQIISTLSDDLQHKAISFALRIADKLIMREKDEGVAVGDKDRHNCNADNRDRVRRSIFSLLLKLQSVKKDILIPFRECLVDHVILDSSDYPQDFDLLKTQCNIVAKLACIDEQNRELDFVMICRSLLFSAPRTDPRLSISEFNEQLTQRQIRGMVFAHAIVSCCDLELTTLVTIQSMVSRILVSSHADILNSDTRVSLYGMQIIRQLQARIVNPSSRKKLFQAISLVLTHSRVVQYPDGSSKHTRNKQHTFLAYTEEPSFCSIEEKTTRRTFREMIFCFGHFFTDETELTRRSIWERSTSWIFELVDCYLALGRTTKWNPRAWIFASIVIPAVSSSTLVTKTREKSLREWMESSFSRFECLQQNPLSTSTIGKQVADLIKKARVLAEKEEIVDSACRFTLTLLFTLSSSAAILRNLYDHYKGMLEEEGKGRKFERKMDFHQMMHYQLLKMYDLKRKCLSMERLFRNIESRNHGFVHKKTEKSKRRRLNKTHSSNEKMKRKVKLARLYLKEANVRFFQSTTFIPSEVLWVSLTDSSHDTLIVSAVDNSQRDETFGTIFDIVQMRLNLTEHLETLITSLASTECTSNEVFSKKNQEVQLRHANRCLRLASFLLLKLPFIKEAKSSHASAEALTKLISAYLRLVCRILIASIQIQNPEYSKRSDGDLARFFWLYTFVIGSKQPLNSTVEFKKNIHSPTIEDYKALICSFKERVQDCHDSITSQLLETLSIFAARSEPTILTFVINFHWDATFMFNYSNAGDLTNYFGPPFVLTKLLDSLSYSSVYGFSFAGTQDRYRHQTPTKLLNCRFNKFGERNVFLAQSMCRHWSLLALSPRKMTLFTTFLETLMEKLLEYLKDVDDCFSGSRTDSKESDSKESKEFSDDGDGEYLPPSTSAFRVCKASIPSPGEFKCLTPTSYPVFFDLILRTTVASISLFSMPDAMSSFENPVVASYRLHPVSKLQTMVEVYGSLVRLYKGKFHVFPKFVFSSVIHASKCMLDISASKVEDYLEWRNNQPVNPFEEVGSDFFDPASMTFLKNLLDIFGIHVIGTLRLFCSTHPEATKSLGRKVERIFDFISQTSNRYSTGNIRTDNTANDAMQVRSEEKAELLQSVHSKVAGELPEKGVNAEQGQAVEGILDSSLIRKRKRTRDNPHLSSKGYGHDELEDEESYFEGVDESSSSTSDEFGVSGDWGQDDTYGQEEYNSKFYVDWVEKST